MEQLEKQTTNFQKMANDRAILLSEEKKEKAELRKKYDVLQKDLIERIEKSSEEKERISKSVGKWARRFYFLL